MTPDTGSTTASDPDSNAKTTSSDAICAADDTGFYEAYGGFARSLRTWFIAYGIGAPVLLISNEDVWKMLSQCSRQIAYCFLGGVFIQIFSALLYKTAMWYLYMGENNAQFRKRRRYKASEWLSEAFWLELILDCTTLSLFIIATYRVLGVCTK